MYGMFLGLTSEGKTKVEFAIYDFLSHIRESKVVVRARTMLSRLTLDRPQT
jgi:hypothetical protein